MKRLVLGLFIALVACSICKGQDDDEYLRKKKRTLISSALLSPVILSATSDGVDNAWLNGTGGSGFAVPAPSFTLVPSLPFRGGANNCGYVAFPYNSSYTISSVTDDKSETWVAGPTVNDANGVTFALYYVLGTTAGTSKITVAFTGTPGTLVTELSSFVGEVKNCGTTIGPNGTMDTAATGSAITLTLGSAPTSGDLVLAFFFDTNGGRGVLPPVYDTTITVGSGFTLATKSLGYGKVSEYSTTTSSTSVPITYSGTNKILGLAIVFKQGSAGTSAPATKYIDRFVSEAVVNTSTPTLYFPCGGNLIVLLYFSNDHSANVTATSGASATWATGPLSSTNALVQIPYGTGATCASTTTISPTLGHTPTNTVGTEFYMVSVTNATSTFDNSVVATPGNQTTAADVSTVSITPGALNEITFGIVGLTFHTPTGTAVDGNSHTPVWMASVNTKADNADPVTCSTSTANSTLAGDNGLAYYQNTGDTTAITFIWHGTQTTGSCTTHPSGVNGWDSVAAAFK